MASTESHELALTVINTGEGYKRRCAVALAVRLSPSCPDARFFMARHYEAVSKEAALKYEKDFGTPGVLIFSAADILAAAAEIADYYARHVGEFSDADIAYYRENQRALGVVLPA